MSKSYHEDSDLLLYFHHNSFYSQKVIMTLHEKKLNFKTHLVNLASNEQYESWFLEVNPLGEVPVLVDGVKIIPDSKRIIQYVEDNFSNGYKRLLPTDMDSKMDVIALRDEIDSLPVGLITKGAPHHPDFLLNPKSPFLPSNRAFMMDNQSRKPQVIRKAADVNPSISDILLDKATRQEQFNKELNNVQNYEQALERVDEVMNRIEAILIENNKEKPKTFVYLFSTDFTMADISLTVLLVRLDQLGLSHRYWNGSLRPIIAQYYSQVKQRESFKLTIPPYGANNDTALWYLKSHYNLSLLNPISEKPKTFVYLFSTDFTMADISLTVLLVRLDQLGLSHRYWNGSLRPIIAQYYSQVKQRESFKLTIPPYGANNDTALWYLVSGLSVLVILSAVYFFRRRK
ncbi:hypothetical protein M8J75_005176 [Diaphorina citri]|nr:hypothetical protein M8J75_005176 [Diaphorina citri]